MTGQTGATEGEATDGEIEFVDPHEQALAAFLRPTSV